MPAAVAERQGLEVQGESPDHRVAQLLHADRAVPYAVLANTALVLAGLATTVLFLRPAARPR